MSGDDAFRETAQKKYLKEATITKLLEQEYESVPAIATLTEDVIAEMKLSRPQSALLLKWVQEVQSYPDGNIPEEQAPVDARPKTTARLVTFPDLHTDGGNNAGRHVRRNQPRIYGSSSAGYVPPLTGSHASAPPYTVVESPPSYDGMTYPVSDIGESAMEYGISKEALHVLCEEGFDTLDKVKLMSEDDVLAMDILRGQKAALSNWIKVLLQPTDVTHQARAEWVPSMENCNLFSRENTKELQDDQTKRNLQTPAKGRPSEDNGIFERMQMSEEAGRKIPVADLVGIIDKGAHDFMAADVKIAIIGRSGVGKSTLINAILNLRPGDDGAADVGPVENTVEAKPYKHPEMPRVVLWDLPGVGTRKFPKKSYLNDVSFYSFDAFVIVCSKRVCEEDTWLAMHAKNLCKPFYFVRSQIDQDIENVTRDRALSPEAALAIIRENAQDILNQNNIENAKIYLVSGRLDYQTEWDFPLLMQQLIERTPKKNTVALVMAMVSCSKKIIGQKISYFHSRINQIADQAVNAGPSFLHVVSEEINLYVDRFGVSESSLEKCKVDMTKLDRKLQDIDRGLREAVSKLESRKSDNEGVMCAIAKWKIFAGYDWAKGIIKAADEPFDVKMTNKERDAHAKKVEMMKSTAVIALESALDQCEQLVLGVLEERQNLATKGFIARVEAKIMKGWNYMTSYLGRK